MNNYKLLLGMVIITVIVVLLSVLLSQRCTCQENYKMILEDYNPRRLVEEYKPRRRMENMNMLQPAIDGMRNTVADTIDDFVEDTIRPQEETEA